MFKGRNIELKILFIALLFLRFPPLYFLGIQNAILTTQFLSVCIILLLFGILILKTIKNSSQFIENSPEMLLILAFFASQAISILSAQDQYAFFQRFSKLVLGIIIFIVVRNLKNRKNKEQYLKKVVVLALFLGSIPALFLQVLTLTSPLIYMDIGRFFINRNLFNISETNVSVGKILDDSFIEIITPIYTAHFLNSTNRFKKVIYFSLMCILGLVSFASNFRYRLIAFIFGFLITIILFSKNYLKQILLSFLVLIMVFSIGDSIIQNSIGFSLIDRFSLQNNVRDISTLSWRERMFNESIQMGANYTFGVGLGNFYYNVTEKTNIYSNTLVIHDIFNLAVTNGPHNIFFQMLAETGFIGVLSFVILLGFYLKRDIVTVRNGTKDTKLLIYAFWTLIVICQFFPSNNLSFYSLFFLLRAAI